MRFFQKNNPWAGLEGILHNRRKTLMSSVHLCLFSWEGFPRQSCINQVSKLVKHGCNYGHHDCSTTAVFLCTAVKLQSCHMLAHWTQHIGPSPVSIRIHLRISFSCSMKFFPLKITLGLALGESWPLLAQPQKSIDVYKGLLPWEGLPRQTSINHLQWNKDVSSWIKFRLYNNSCAPALGGACAMGTNTMALIQAFSVQAIMTVPQRLHFSAQLSNCNLATCWHIELSILGLLQFQSAFIWEKALVVLWSSFNWKSPLGWPRAILGRCLRNHR